jgi:excisionase family DNA binding protein
MARNMVDQPRATPPLIYKRALRMSAPYREALAVRWGTTMETLVDRVIRLNFGNIRDYEENKRILLEQRDALSALLFPRLPPCPEPRGCAATALASPAAHAGRWPDVLNVSLTAQWLTVSADTVDALLQRGDLPGGTVGRQWLITTTAVLQWLEQSATPRPSAAQATALARAMAHGDIAALVEAVQTGHARLGTQVQHAARSGRIQGGDHA